MVEREIAKSRDLEENVKSGGLEISLKSEKISKSKLSHKPKLSVPEYAWIVTGKPS